MNWDFVFDMKYENMFEFIITDMVKFLTSPFTGIIESTVNLLALLSV